MDPLEESLATHVAHSRSRADIRLQRLSNNPQRASSRLQEAGASKNKGPNANLPSAIEQRKAHKYTKLIRNQQPRRTALPKVERLPAQLLADLANDGVDEGRLGHVELAGRHERDGQGN